MMRYQEFRKKRKLDFLIILLKKLKNSDVVGSKKHRELQLEKAFVNL